MDGLRREVTTDDMEHPVFVVSFTVPEAARAVGRTELCFRRWVNQGIVPPPILRDTTRNYRVYSVGEMTAIARVLAAHERDFKYLALKHDRTINEIWQSVQGHRATRI